MAYMYFFIFFVANDSFYFTSQTPLNFTDSNMFCKDKGATLASSFSNQHLYSSKTANGTYWTPITRKNQQRRKGSVQFE